MARFSFVVLNTNTMKHIVILFGLLLTSFVGFSQVGIGTVTPDPSSILDISASEKGILIPRVALGDVTDSMLDGINTAATGLLIFNTNASVTGGSGVGYYYFNGTNWERIATGVMATGTDSDWYEEGTTNSPDDINDNQFTMGEVGIGLNSPAYQLDINDFNHDRAINLYYSRVSPTTDIAGIYSETSDSNSGNTSRGIYNYVRGSGGDKHGIYNRITPTNFGTHVGTHNQVTNNAGGQLYGTYNTLNSSSSTATQTGTYNQIAVSGTQNRGVYNTVSSGSNSWGVKSLVSGSGTLYGMENDITASGSSGVYGTHNQLGGTGSGLFMGTYNELGGTSSGDKIGSYNLVDPSASGTHYGLYSNVLKSGSFAGFFVGNVAIGTYDVFGTGSPDYYIFPTSRGTADQIMQTDGSGNLSWVDPGSLSDGDWIVDTSMGTVLYPPNNTDNVAVGKTTANAKLDVESDSSGTTAAFSQINSTGTAGALTNSVSGNSGNVNGFVNSLNVGGTGIKQAILNTINSGSSGASGIKYGLSNSIESMDGDAFGSANTLFGPGDGDYYGTYNDLDGAGSGSKYGSYNIVSTAANGDLFGVYSEVLRSTGTAYAGYFLGNVAIGTTTSNTYRLPTTRGTNGQIMQTDAAGNVSWANVPASTDKAAIQIVPSANISGFSNATETALIFSSLNYNLGGGTHNTLTGAYTVPAQGVYDIDVNLNVNFVSSTNKQMVIIIRVFVNGVQRAQQNLQDGATYLSSFTQNFDYNFHLGLNANDVVTFRFIPVWGGTTPAPFINSSETNISVTRVY